MPTIAVKQSTWERLKWLMREEKAQTLDQTISLLIEKAERLPKSMFGIDKRLKMTFTQLEHKEFQRSHNM